MFHLGEITVDLERREIRAPGQPAQPLTPNEHRLLEVLVAHANTAVTRQVLLEALGYRPGLTTRAVSHAVLRIRRKIEDDPANPRHLHTIYGVGYRLDIGSSLTTEADVEADVDVDVDVEADSSFLGRASDIHRLSDAMGASRLVTVLGPAGVGKTTLAQRYIRSVDRALFVELAGVADHTGLSRSVASALGISLRKGQLLRSLRARRDLLLVLDNAEHLIREVTSVLPAWLSETRIRVLVTSRRVLGLDAEHVLPLAPLSVASSMALFQARAPGTAGGAALEKLVKQLDQLPLAIELAAGRSDLLTVEQISARLGQRFKTLRSHRPGLPLRQASMWAALDSSWEQLSDGEREVMSACAMFTAPFPIEAVEAMLPDGDVLSRLSVLRGASMLSVSDGLPRMLQSIRDFARARTPGPAASVLAVRHAAWVLAQAEAHARGLHRGGWTSGIAGLKALEPELMAIWQQHDTAPPERLARAAMALDALWVQDAPIDQHRALMDKAWRLPGLPDPVRARLTALLGRLLSDLSQHAAAAALFDTAEGMSSDQSTGLMIRRLRASLYIRTRELDRATQELEETLATAQAVRDPWHEGMVLAELSRVYQHSGQLDRSESLALRALALLLKTGHQFGVGCLYEQLGRLLCERGELAGAIAEYQRSNAIWTALGMPAAVAENGINLGSVLLHRREPGTDTVLSTFDPAAARSFLLPARRRLQEAGHPIPELFALVNLVRAAIFLDSRDEAEHLCTAAQALLLRSQALPLLRWLVPILHARVAWLRGEAAAVTHLRRGRRILRETEMADAALIGQVAEALATGSPPPALSASDLRRSELLRLLAELA